MTRGRAGVLAVIAAVMTMSGCSDDNSSPDRIDDRAEFTRRAAAACGEVVDRRAADPTYAQHRGTVLEAVAAALQGKPVADGVAVALEAVEAEFRTAAGDLGRLRPTAPDFAAAWAQVIEALNAEATVSADRRAALAGGTDATRRREAFAPGRAAVDLTEPLKVLGLTDRDCRLLLR
ncbi:hypothetical protein [Yinghuangia sp. YIM S09857]|uniref:hypothetical protein n=1 Tax=Yinghuangia sp. YIM S09857 TaxID=3436929 RepID=UPI003F5292B2